MKTAPASSERTVEGYPQYARSARIADGVVHLLGVVLSIAAATALIHWAFEQQPDRALALSIYAAALVATFTASACYHMTPWEAPRHILRRIDHAMIFFKIAATYTPFVVMIGTTFAYAVLGVVWAVAMVGVVLKLFFWRIFSSSVALYIALGWASVLLIWSVVTHAPPLSAGLMVAGGVIYTAGTAIFVREDMKFAMPIWHGFVLTGSLCLFAAISTGALV